MTLRDKIKELCKQSNISLNKLESDLGFAKGYISKLDKSTPNSSKLQQIANYFGISLDSLLGEGNTNEPSKYVLKDVYFSFAKEMQEKNISESDMQKLWQFYEMIKNK